MVTLREIAVSVSFIQSLHRKRIDALKRYRLSWISGIAYYDKLLGGCNENWSLADRLLAQSPTVMRREVLARIWVAIAIFIGWANAAAAAQTTRVPVVVPASDNGCFPGHILGLERADGFLAVRSGPSARDRELDRLYNGDEVFTCQRNGRWIGIAYAPRGSGIDCHAHRQWLFNAAYTGPCRSGWVHRDWVAVADFFDDELAFDGGGPFRVPDTPPSDNGDFVVATTCSLNANGASVRDECLVSQHGQYASVVFQNLACQVNIVRQGALSTAEIGGYRGNCRAPLRDGFFDDIRASDSCVAARRFRLCVEPSSRVINVRAY